MSPRDICQRVLPPERMPTPSTHPAEVRSEKGKRVTYRSRLAGRLAVGRWLPTVVVSLGR